MKRKLTFLNIMMIMVISISTIVFASSDSDSGTLTSGIAASTTAALTSSLGYYFPSASASITGTDVAYVYSGDGVTGAAGCSYSSNIVELYNTRRSVSYSNKYKNKPYKAYASVTGYGKMISSEAY